ncbi:MAG TPA: OsmC family protein [Vicinamibacteria bacterium]|nr:OsmC family protein [Vicinamibacteria bacterium]
MAIRTAKAEWNGNLTEGKGTMSLGSGAYQGAYSFSSRFEEGAGTNPEELIAAAHAGCYSMALAAGLAKGGFSPERVASSAKLQLLKTDAGFTITTIELDVQAKVPGIDDAKFQEIAEGTRKGCPVSRALTGVEIKVSARLV